FNMYKRKFNNDIDRAVMYKKARIDCPDIAPKYRKHAIQAAPTTQLSVQTVPLPLKKRKRSAEECEAEPSSDREARRIKSSHNKSNQSTYPWSLSPASEHQIFPNNPTSAAKNTTTDFVLPIRLVRPQHLSKGEDRARKTLRRDVLKKIKITTQQQVQESDNKQQPHKRRQRKQRNPISAQIQDSVPKKRSRLYYSSILEMCDAASDRFELDWVI
ncbi:hypothetical protein V8C35DRAFT_287528, partial [Trichoderma chlorosporum]